MAAKKGTKKDDLKVATDDQLQTQLTELKREAVQPALPGGDQPAREAVAGERGAPHHRSHQDASEPTRPHRRSGAGLRRLEECPSAS